jgi:antitoxin CptB
MTSVADRLEAGKVRRKRLLYQCNHRGMKEMDIILGGFAARALDRLADAELDALEALLALPDDLLYRWIAGREPTPSAHDSGILRTIVTEAAAHLPGPA